MRRLRTVWKGPDRALACFPNVQVTVLPHLAVSNHCSWLLWQDLIGGRLAARTWLDEALLRNIDPYAAASVIEGFFLLSACLFELWMGPTSHPCRSAIGACSVRQWKLTQLAV